MSSWGFLTVISSSWNKDVGSAPEISLNTFTFSGKFRGKNMMFWCQRYGPDSYTGDLVFLTWQSPCMWSKLWATWGSNGAGCVCVYKYFTLIITILTATVINICQAHTTLYCTQMFNCPVHPVPFNSMVFRFAKFNIVMCFCSSRIPCSHQQDS